MNVFRTDHRLWRITRTVKIWLYIPFTEVISVKNEITSKHMLTGGFISFQCIQNNDSLPLNNNKRGLGINNSRYNY